MTAWNGKYLLYSLIIYIFILTTSATDAAVSVFDTIAIKGMPVRLTVLTKGRFFSEGGRLVDIYLEQQHIGRILSGGDGYGFLKYTPAETGIKEIGVRSDGDTDEGILMVIKKGEKAVVIEIEAFFGKSLFYQEVKTESKKTIAALSRRYQIVYLTRLMGIALSKKVLAENQYPRSVIFQWQGSETLDELKEKGLILHAIVASSDLLSESTEHIDRRYCFGETEEGMEVNNWDEILKDLNKKKKEKK